ncbi:MAG: 16S rRNA (cytosine(1402)-N(4))-methyltransferase RsmH [Lachnospiraceae bacterium]|nr:16S rRNA (cytosine(1402)-N(4))-methyltransferase RsmH [Lachnospiraceae bacterium]
MTFSHRSVLLDESIAGLQIKPEGIYMDGTLGGGGHALEVARRLKGKGRLYGIDRDEEALHAAKERLKEHEDRVTFIRDTFENGVLRLRETGVSGVDGILLDLGVSSYQLDNPERGFSYNQDTALDMRMDQRQSLTAKQIVNEYSREELARIISEYGEDKFARNIAKHIEEARKQAPIETTFQLNEIIKAAIPTKMRAEGGHPSKRTFQAIRIECNRELEGLRNALEEMIPFLNPGGRICIITFHSLEDRIVKSAFKMQENPCTCPPEFPVCVCGKKPLGKVITRKPILPSKEEMAKNSRAKSAKLRIFERG